MSLTILFSMIYYTNAIYLFYPFKNRMPIAIRVGIMKHYPIIM